MMPWFFFIIDAIMERHDKTLFPSVRKVVCNINESCMLVF